MKSKNRMIIIAVCIVLIIYSSAACYLNDGSSDGGSSGEWRQKEFIIGGYDGVRLMGNQEEDMKILKTYTDAGFNVMVGTQYWYSTRWFNITGHEHNPNAVSNKYVLELMAAFNKEHGKNKVRLITHDRGLGFNNVPVYQEYREELFKNYLELPKELRDCLYGYNLLDEPNLETLKASLNAIRSAREIDKEKMVFVNLGDTGEDFRTCVRELAQNSSMVSFDLYSWNSAKGKPTRYIHKKHFEYLQITAEEARDANVPWWGVPLSVEHERRDEKMKVLWGFMLHDPDKRDPKSEKARIRFNAYSCIIYGAKGLIWYSYDTSNCPITNPDRIEPFLDPYIPYTFHDACVDYDGNPSIFYDYVKEVNMKVLSMESILMDLTWLSTVHGTSYNNYDAVPRGSLPVVEESTPVVSSISMDSTLAVGIFEGKDKNKYLMVMNKDIDYDKTYTIELKNAKKVYIFNSSNRKWEEKELAGSGSITVDVETGDLELLKVIE
jgi:hypothetical protein